MSARAPSPPVMMVDVVRELQSIAGVAEHSGDHQLVAACRQSLLARLWNQFVQDLIGPEAPSERAA